MESPQEERGRVLLAGRPSWEEPRACDLLQLKERRTARAVGAESKRMETVWAVGAESKEMAPAWALEAGL